MPRTFSELAELGIAQTTWQLENRDTVRYVSDGQQGFFLRYDRQEKTLEGIFSATSDEYRDLDREASLRAGDFFAKPRFDKLETLPPRRLEANDRKPDGENKADEKDPNSLQTENEAKVAKDGNLIDRIQNIYKSDSCKEILEQKIDFSNLTTIPKFNDQLQPIGKEPLVQTTFICVFGNFIPEMVIFEPEELVILSRRDVNVTQAKKFLFQRIEESSKMSVGLGLPLLSSSGIATDGPEVGQPAFADGEPKVDSAGAGLSFNFSLVQQYSELTIQASMDITLEVEGYEVLRVPRKKSSGSSQRAATVATAV